MYYFSFGTHIQEVQGILFQFESYLLFPAFENTGIVAVGGRIGFLAIFFSTEVEIGF